MHHQNKCNRKANHMGKTKNRSKNPEYNNNANDNTQDYQDRQRKTSSLIPIFEERNCYYLDRGNEQTAKQLTNFVMEPLKGIKMQDGDKTEIEFHLQDGQIITSLIDGTSFSSVQQFRRQIKKLSGIDMTFCGNEVELVFIQNYMKAKYAGYKHCTGLPYTGIYKKDGEWIYVGEGKTVDARGKTTDSIISVVEDNKAIESDILDVKPITKTELKLLSRDLFRFNTYERTVNIIGWCCCAFLKERLRQKRIKFPHLVISGQAGSGKSETEEKIIQPIFSMQGGGIMCGGISKFSILKTLNSTNLVPVIYEEYKPSRIGKIAVDLMSDALRGAYDCQVAQRGRPDQSVVNYMRRAPIVVVGESSFDEPAVRERIIDVQFAESDRDPGHTKHFNAICGREQLLNRLGKSLLQMTLYLADERLNILIEESKVFADQKLKSRTILGMSNVFLGILFLSELYSSYGLSFWEETGLTDEIVKNSIIGNAVNNQDGGMVESIITDSIAKLDTMAKKGIYRKGIDFLVSDDKNELCLRLNLMYDEFTKYLRDKDVNCDRLSFRQFTKQLRKETYFKGYDNRTFKESGDGNQEERAKCYILDLKKLCASCPDLEVFKSKFTTDCDGFMVVDEQTELPFT